MCYVNTAIFFFKAVIFKVLPGSEAPIILLLPLLRVQAHLDQLLTSLHTDRSPAGSGWGRAHEATGATPEARAGAAGSDDSHLQQQLRFSHRKDDLARFSTPALPQHELKNTYFNKNCAKDKTRTTFQVNVLWSSSAAVSLSLEGWPCMPSASTSSPPSPGR